MSAQMYRRAPTGTLEPQMHHQPRPWRWAIPSETPSGRDATIATADALPIGGSRPRTERRAKVPTFTCVDKPASGTLIVEADLYPDALPCLRAAAERGLIVGIAGNQPAGVEEQLRAAGFSPNFLASSAAWGVEKPSPEFFDRIVTQAGVASDSILHVGDRLDNDVSPARAAGMRTAFIRRGPWGHLHAERPEVALADLRLDDLADLTEALVTGRRSEAYVSSPPRALVHG